MKTVIKIKAADTSGKVDFWVDSVNKIKKITLKIFEKDTERRFEYAFCCDTQVFRGDFVIEDVKLWSINSPNLYTYQAKIEYETGNEIIDGRFGLRLLSTDEHNIFVNGEMIYIRGDIRGAKAHEHSNNCVLSEEEFYRKNILTAKKFGFNFVRFHSVVPNETFFNVADELGMLVHLELRSPKDEYNNLEEMLYGKKDLVSDTFIEQVIDRVYNHPSLAVYCIGNELKAVASQERINEIGRKIKALDDSRFFLDSCAWGENGRENVDMDVQHMSYYFPYGKNAGMYENADHLLVCGSADGKAVMQEGENSKITRSAFFKVPLIAHEVCHYTALRDFISLKEKFQKYGVEEPWWIDEELKMIKEKGFADNYKEFYSASKYFQLECWKTAFEKMRGSNLLGGFHFLQFADTDVYENSNGVVDCFDDEIYVTPADFKKFNSDCVILADLPERIFFAGDTFCAPLRLSDYREKDFEEADLSYVLTGKNGEVYAEGALDRVDIRRRGIYEICKLYLTIPAEIKADALTLKVVLKNGDKTIAENSWNIWAYEKKDIGGYKDFCAYEQDDVIVTDDIQKALSLLQQEKKVCLVYRQDWTRHLLDKNMPVPKYAFKATWNRFKPVIWDRGTNYGGLCNQDILNKYGFATGRLYDYNYSVLTEDCDKIILDDFPVNVEPILLGIDKNVRDRFDAYAVSFNLPELQYDRTLRKFGYLFELKVGKGSLLVCGLNMTGLDTLEASTVAMANWILQYMNSSDFNPAVELSIDEFKDYMVKCAEKPVKERMMTQFWQLNDTPVESKEYWTESRKYLLEK